MTMAEKIQGIKQTMQFGKRAMEDSKNWTSNQAGGWEILARGYRDSAEQLLQMLEQLLEGNENA